jgi:hypothetical protein
MSPEMPQATQIRATTWLAIRRSVLRDQPSPNARVSRHGPPNAAMFWGETGGVAHPRPAE